MRASRRTAPVRQPSLGCGILPALAMASASCAASGKEASPSMDLAAAIRLNRMGTIDIRTRPLARVVVTQLRHEFEFGTAISRRMFRDGGNDYEKRRYLEILAANFNVAVHENALKWYSTERTAPGAPDYAAADRMLEWCERRGIRMRGHCVYWGRREARAEVGEEPRQ